MSRPVRGRVVIVVINNLKRDSRVQKEALALRKAGYEVVTVGIVTQPDDLTEEVADWGRVVRVVTSEAVGSGQGLAGTGVGASRSGEGPRGWRAVLARSQYLDEIRHFAGRLRENLLIYRRVRTLAPDVVVACDLNALPAGSLLQQLGGSGLVYDSHELWTETSDTRSRLWKTLWSTLEGILARRADGVVTVNFKIAEELARRYGITPPVVVHNGARECVASARPAGRPLRLLFQGFFAGNRGLDTLIDAVGLLHGDFVLSIQGWGPLQAELQARAERRGVADKVRFVDPCPPDEVVASAHEHDVGMICHRPTAMNLVLSSPNKLFDYLAAGLAVAASDVPVIRHIIDEHRCGIVFDPTSPESMARALQPLVDDPDRVSGMKERGLRAGRVYAWDNEVQGLLRTVDRAGGGR